MTTNDYKISLSLMWCVLAFLVASNLVVDGFSCGSFMNCKSFKPEDHYFWFQLQSEENDRSVHFLVRVMLKLEKDAMGSLSKVTASTDLI